MQTAENPPAMRWLRLDDWFVLFTEPALELHDGDWEHMLTKLRDPSLRGFISIINHDGHPSVRAQHLHAAADAVLDADYNVAVLSSHRVTLALARILHWFGISIRCFSSSELAQALEWIEVPHERHPHFMDVINRLRKGEAVDVEVFNVRSI